MNKMKLFLILSIISGVCLFVFYFQSGGIDKHSIKLTAFDDSEVLSRENRPEEFSSQQGELNSIKDEERHSGDKLKDIPDDVRRQELLSEFSASEIEHFGYDSKTYVEIVSTESRRQELLSWYSSSERELYGYDNMSLEEIEASIHLRLLITTYERTDSFHF